MAKVWVLDHETKGTGASIVPLETTVTAPDSGTGLPYVAPEPRPRPAKAPEPRKPRVFKLVDVVSGDVLTEGADVRSTLEILAGLRSVVDVRIYVWQPKAASWRLLTLGEQKALWGFRRSVSARAS